MANEYTRNWDSTSPVGSRAANEIDDAIREKLVDIEERVADKLMSLPATRNSADVVVKPEILGNVTGKKLLIPFTDFQPTEDDDDIFYGGVTHVEPYYLTDNNINRNVAYCGIKLPPGVTITQVDLICDIFEKTSVKAQLYKATVAAGTQSQIGADATRSVAGVGAASIASLSETLDGTAFYFVRATGSVTTGRFKVYGVVVTYTTPDCRNTI